MERTSANWLQEVLGQAVREGWCTQRNCTTCGSPEMRAVLTGCSWRRGERLVSLNALTWERAEQVVEGLPPCEQVGHTEAIMWLLHAIWLRFGDRAHQDLFPRLHGSAAGTILERMRAHYARVGRKP